MASQNNNKIEICLEYANERVRYRMNGKIYETLEEVKKNVNRNFEIKWCGVYPFDVFKKMQAAESKLLKILNA